MHETFPLFDDMQAPRPAASSLAAVPSQRWRDKRTQFCTPEHRFDPSRHEAVVLGEADAKAFCQAHHYSGTMPAARFRVGLMRKMPFQADILAGVAVFSVPMQGAVLSKYLGPQADMQTGCELGRFVLLDSVEWAGESWFIGAANKLLAQHSPIRSIVSFSDPVARQSEYGEILKPGHFGVVYQATNARMVGRSKARTLVLTRSGLVISDRTLSKIRNDEVGADYAYRQLRAAGAPARHFGESGQDYVRRALKCGAFTRSRHPGNFVYCWAVGSASERKHYARGFLPALAYPKAVDYTISPILVAPSANEEPMDLLASA